MFLFQEMANHTYSLKEVLSFTKENKYSCGECSIGEVYHAYVGREDQPDVYDKRACLIIKDLEDKVLVCKITSKGRNDYFRYKLKSNEDLNFPGPSFVRMDNKPCLIDKKWITMFDGKILNEDKEEILKRINLLKKEK